MPAEETGIADAGGADAGPVDAGSGASALDEAWEAARAAELAQEGDSDAVAARFIDVVLNEPLFCPVWEDEDDSAESGAAETGAEEEISPKMIERDGVDTLLLFDSEERLAAYVDEPTPFVALPGRMFFDLARGQGAQIALNLDVAPSSTVFSPETVDAIAELVAAADETLDISADAPLQVGPPANASEALLSALSARLAAARSVAGEAWLFSVSYPAEDGREVQHLVLGVVGVEGADGREQRGLAGELSRLGGVLLDDSTFLDVAWLVEGERLLGLARRFGVGLGGGRDARDASAA